MTLTIVFLDRETLPPEIIVRPLQIPHRWTDYQRTAPEEVVPRAADADIIVVNKVALRRETLARLPRLRMVAVAATGTDNVDVGWCREHGIAVTNVRGYAVHSVPEHVFALVLALRRGLFAYRDDMRRGRWPDSPQFCFFAAPMSDLNGSRLGIVGRGSIGRAVASIGRAFGMTPQFAGRKGAAEVPSGCVPFPQMLAESDVITLHCPLTPETRDLIGESEFRLMRQRPLLINTARGGLVDDAALVAAMDEGLIAGAAVDVLSHEPPPFDHPLLPLLERPNFMMTPHVAWASRQAMQRLANQVIDNIEAFATSGA
jgi:glycerate dehydrogenase